MNRKPPKRPTIIADSETRRAIDTMLLRIAEAHGVWLSHVVGRRKTVSVVAARTAMLAWLRLEVRMIRKAVGVVCLGMADDSWYSGWQPVSYPVCAEILGTDHSTLVTAAKRMARRAERNDPSPKEIAARTAAIRDENIERMRA